MLNPKITENEVIFEDIDDECLDLSEKSELDEDVSETFKQFQGKNLIFRNCSKLKEIDADCLGLKGIKFEGDCSQLEHLSAYGNEINKLDLTNKKQLNYLNVDDNKLEILEIKGCENLDKLSCRNNKLNSLNLDDNTQLTYLNCANNQINQLLVKHLEYLKTLRCNNNCLLELDPSGLTHLQFLDCSNNGWVSQNLLEQKKLNYLNVDGCVSLLEIDAGENELEEVELNKHPRLWNVSFKTNLLTNLVIEKCPNLHFLTISYQVDRVFNLFHFFEINRLDTPEKVLNFFRINVPRRSLSDRGINTVEEVLNTYGIDSIEKIIDCHKSAIFKQVLNRLGIDTPEEPSDYLSIEELLDAFGFDTIEKALNYANYQVLLKKIHPTSIKFNVSTDEYIHTNFFIDEVTRKAIRGMLYSEDISFYDAEQIDSGYASENEEENETNPQSFTIEDFPNLDKEESGIDRLADNPLFELWRDRKQAEQLNQEIGYDSGYEDNQKKKNN